MPASDDDESMDDPNEFGRPRDFTTQAAGPREFARATAGSRIERVGESKVITPAPPRTR